MRRLLWPCIALVAWAAVISNPGHADPPPGYPFLRYDEAIKSARQQDKKIFVYYGRYGCGFCDKTNKKSFSDPALRKLYTEHYILAYVDAESGKRLVLPNGERITEMELGARLKAKVTPVFIYMDAEGKSLLRVPGFQTVQDFIRHDRYIHGDHYKNQTLDQFLSQLR
ncbi:MAG: thioredoxin [Candidatus Muproteobacteria bacterium RIFCSPLOWO2_01_FULL_60_18]|uniref:Thioredoxin n=1 Tax=Candidatus Muproteobacteria bacterium RIFCSPLOWO2_01_FULL_60_18 TaxID=1817768 RepID=A0A1F6TYR6_9PROT|nr:MAG: thioredoxin [Candidatus Muproteobacteria bacterium RIFCSPHIGHO2_01_60_12]OGI50246.1 MAG: thioredoxin [Candidatus Muproteobacteria bacterium RIFCSPLOWO2_01_FULL_60_18]